MRMIPLRRGTPLSQRSTTQRHQADFNQKAKDRLQHERNDRTALNHALFTNAYAELQSTCYQTAPQLYVSDNENILAELAGRLGEFTGDSAEQFTDWANPLLQQACRKKMLLVQLFEHRDAIEKSVARVLGKTRRHMLEDVTSLVTAHITARIDSFRGESSLVTWAKTCATNRAIDWLRGQKLREGGGLIDDCVGADADNIVYPHGYLPPPKPTKPGGAAPMDDDREDGPEWNQAKEDRIAGIATVRPKPMGEEWHGLTAAERADMEQVTECDEEDDTEPSENT